MSLKIIGRLFITFNIKTKTGLHIGGTNTGIEIGGVDNAVIRDPLTQKPYVPGSSLKGKIRNLLEKHLGKPIGKSGMHLCEKPEDYQDCEICTVFGVPAKLSFASPTRLLVRDILLSDRSAQELSSPDIHTDLRYTEVKTEVAIDRITSAANPRPVERVPAGAVFGPGEMVYTIYSSDDGLCDPKKDVEHVLTLFKGMALLEDDYLGGMGSRGSGKVAFEKINIELRKRQDYFTQPIKIGEYETMSRLLTAGDDVRKRIKEALNL